MHSNSARFCKVTKGPQGNSFTSPSAVLLLLQAVRHQAAAVLAALALSSPPLLARLFGDCLEGVETFCQQLMLLAAPYNKPRSVTVAISTAAGPGDTRGHFRRIVVSQFMSTPSHKHPMFGGLVSMLLCCVHGSAAEQEPP